MEENFNKFVSELRKIFKGFKEAIISKIKEDPKLYKLGEDLQNLYSSNKEIIKKLFLKYLKISIILYITTLIIIFFSYAFDSTMLMHVSSFFGEIFRFGCYPIIRISIIFKTIIKIIIAIIKGIYEAILSGIELKTNKTSECSGLNEDYKEMEEEKKDDIDTKGRGYLDPTQHELNCINKRINTGMNTYLFLKKCKFYGQMAANAMDQSKNPKIYGSKFLEERQTFIEREKDNEINNPCFSNFHEYAKHNKNFKE